MTKHTTRRAALALAAALSLAAPAAFAQAFPNKPIKLVVNFPPGGAADVIGRTLGQALSEQLKQQVIVENKPGANGNIGADTVAKSPGDGYTLLMSSGGAVTVNPFIYTKMPFDAEKDLLPVASVARVLVFLMAHPSLPVNTAQEFVTYAKANPGKLSFASAGSGSSPHLAGEMFKRQAKFEATHVPYRGAAPALTDLLAGQVQFMFDPGPGLRHAKEGKLKLLAVGSSKRSSQVPDTPTLAEVGMTGFDADTIFGIYAPNGTPAAVVTQLHDEINKALASAKVADVIKGLGGEVAALSRNEFIDRQNKDRERLGAFIKEIGLKVE
ncbi:MAG: tripartite tricarboxylate transporter substrate binding protein [Rubrivivax sp.]|nr:tripartite tricarboxylate transporter substrate binding protein [Rubrivivax sp.]